jgi:hypothetical protein
MPNKTSNAGQKDSNRTRPYPPSFLDRFMRFIQRLSLPYGLTYLILFILQSILLHALSWIDGWLPLFTFDKILLLYPMWLWGPMAIMTYLNSTAETALSTFSPLLDIEEDEIKSLKYQFTTMPNKGLIISSVFWLIFYVIAVVGTYANPAANFGFSRSFLPINYAIGMISFCIGSAIYYHSVRQLVLVNRTVGMVRQFNLFQLDPIYALSRLTSRTGISWMALMAFTLLIFPIQVAPGVSLIILIIQVILALAAFLLPLQKVHSRLVAQKRLLISKLNYRVESTFERLHQSIDNNQLVEGDLLNKVLAGLNMEHDFLKSLPTWPWRPGTLTSFLSALVLPVILLLIQLMIQQWFGG